MLFKNKLLRKVVFILNLLLLSTGCVYAAEGCLIGSASNGTLYMGNYTLDLFLRRTYTASSPQLIVCPSNNSSILHAVNLHQNNFLGITAACRVVSGSYNGTVYTFSLVARPIDDYIPLLLLATGGIGFFFLRNKFNLMPCF